MKKCRVFIVLIASLFIISNQLAAQWTKISQPFYIQVNCLFAHDGDIFAGTWWSGGIFRSSNNGTSWVVCNSGVGEIGVDAFAVHDSYLFTGTNNGVFRSNDNGASWTSVNAGRYDNVTCFAVIDTNLFAGGWGVYRSTNNGNSWNPVNTGLTNYYVRSLMARGGNLFAATWGGGIFLSTNNGTNWTAVNSGLTTTNVNTLAASGSTLYAGTMEGVFYSTTGGTNWERTNLGDYIDAITVSDAYLFAAGANNGIYRSTDRGANWTSINTGLTNRFVMDLCISGTNLFAGTSGGGVFLSTNNGSSWTEVNNGLKTAEVSTLTQNGSNFYAGTRGAGMFLSTDGGNTWGANNLFISNPNIFALAATPSYLILGTNGGGAMRSTYGDYHWFIINSGFPDNPFDVFALAFNNTKLFAGTSAGMYRSTNWGNSWTAINSGLPAHSNVNAITVRDSNLYAAINGQGIYLSTNDGSSWTAFDSNSTSMKAKALAVSDTNLFAGADNGVSLSSTIRTDIKWTQVNSGLTDNTVRSLNVKVTDLLAGTEGGVWRRPLREMINVAPKLNMSGLTFGNVVIGQVKESTITMSNSGTDTLKITNIVSLNSAFSARPIKLNIPPGQSLKDTLRFTPSVAGDTLGKLVVYSNAASSPDTIAISGYGFRAPLLQLNISRVLFGSVMLGQFRDTTITITNTGSDTLKISDIQSTNTAFSARPTKKNIIQGQSFTDTLRFTPNTTASVFGVISIYSNISSSPDIIRLYGDGILTGVGEFVDQIPRAYSLSQNYPNPFNPATTIRYGLSSRSIVSLKIYNYLGQQINELINSEQGAGYYEFEWKAGVPSGVYFYRLQAVSLDHPEMQFVETRKLVLLK